MGARNIKPVTVKKVKPYPIPTKIIKSDTAPAMDGLILRVTKLGFQMEVAQMLFSVNEHLIAEFALPLSNQTLRENVKVVRTMDHYKDDKAKIKSYLVEMHFLNLSAQHAKAIGEFMAAINQKPT